MVLTTAIPNKLTVLNSYFQFSISTPFTTAIEAETKAALRDLDLAVDLATPWNGRDGNALDRADEIDETIRRLADQQKVTKLTAGTASEI